jgi:hypothetical protein
MSCNVYKLTSAASTNVTQIGSSDMATIIKGWTIVNTSAAASFVKFYWAPPGTFSSSGMQPTVGTDVPKITVQIPTVASVSQSFPDGIRAAGQLFIATVTGAADSSAAAVASGDLIISIYYE